MLSCPYCSFENSDHNLICDQCGQSLQRWYGLIVPHPNLTDPEVLPLPAPYLDDCDRYQRLGEPVEEHNSCGLATLTQLVLDCQPELDSPLKALQARWLECPNPDLLTDPEIAALPPLAIPYLALQADYFPAVPELHDVLQTSHHIILLLEDRTQWPSLLQGWPDQALDPLQQTQWLFEITLLWQALAPWQAQTTLLNPQYLVLSPNRLLCLRQLDSPSSTLPTLQDLGQAWQQYLLTEQAAIAPALGTVIRALADGALTELAQLQEALADLAGQYRSAPTPTVAEPAWPPESNPLPIGPDAEAWERSLSDEEFLQLAESQGTLAEADDSNDSVELPTMLLPMKLLDLEDAGQSHVGQQRNQNEDWFITQTELWKVNNPRCSSLNAKGLYILCDGMGGHAAGEVASQLAVTTLQRYFADHWGDHLPPEASLTQAVVKANQAIFDANQAKSSSGVGRMGTTLVMLLVQDLQVAVVHVGDSRLYSYNKRVGLKQLTVDHEVGQREISRGVEPAIAYARPDAYQLTQALGPRNHDNLRPGISYHDIVEDTLFILCSDGLSDNDLLERHTTSHIAPLLRAKANLEEGVSQLIHLANEKNGHDNITAILIRLKVRPDTAHLAGA